jgi:hypothetical protein
MEISSETLPQKEDYLGKLAKRVLYTDLIEVMARQSSPKDIITLAQLYPPRKKALQRIFREIIVTRIDDWFRNYFKENNKYQEFVEAMIKEEAIVSGSFIIQMILNEKWKDSDIDIFTSTHDYCKVSQMTDLRWHQEPFTLIENVIYSDMTEDYYQSLGAGHYRHIRNEEDLSDGGQLCGHGAVMRYTIPFGNKYRVQNLREYLLFKDREPVLKKFQIIRMQNGINLQEFINNAVDFDICKNSFQYIRAPDGTIKMKLKSAKPMEILDRVTGFKVNSNSRASLARCQKYMSRGFKFYDDIDNSLTLDKLAVDYQTVANKIRRRFDSLFAEERKDIQ